MLRDAATRRPDAKDGEAAWIQVQGLQGSCKVSRAIKLIFKDRVGIAKKYRLEAAESETSTNRGQESAARNLHKSGSRVLFEAQKFTKDRQRSPRHARIKLRKGATRRQRGGIKSRMRGHKSS